MSDHLMLFVLVEKFRSHWLGKPDVSLCYKCHCVYFIALEVIVLQRCGAQAKRHPEVCSCHLWIVQLSKVESLGQKTVCQW